MTNDAIRSLIAGCLAAVELAGRKQFLLLLDIVEFTIGQSCGQAARTGGLGANSL